MIPTASQTAHRSSPSATGRQVTSTRAASSAGKASTGRGNSGTRQQPGKTSGNKSPAGSAPASKAALTPAQQAADATGTAQAGKTSCTSGAQPPAPEIPSGRRYWRLCWRSPNVVTLGGYGLSYIQTRLTVQEAEKTAQQSKDEAASLRSELEEMEQNTIPVDTFTNLVAEYNMSAQFIQEFFDDRIVYKDTSVHYAPIDQSLPMNSYDWQYLSWRMGGRPIPRMENGMRHSVSTFPTIRERLTGRR